MLRKEDKAHMDGPDYMILTARDPGSLSSKVTEALLDGWELAGSLQVVSLPGPAGLANIWFYQPVQFWGDDEWVGLDEAERKALVKKNREAVDLATEGK